MGKKIVAKKGPDSVISTESGILLISLAWVVQGFAGYCLFVGSRSGIIMAHIGAVGIMGLLGSLAGFLAKKKGRGFWKAFLLGSVPPTVLAIGAVCLVHGSGGRGCGGIVSIAAAFIVIGYYSFMRKKVSNPQI